MHEDLRREHVVKAGSERSFGIVFAVVFLFIGFMPLLSAGPIRLWALPVGALFLALAFLWTAPLRPLNWLWLRFGLLLHSLINPLTMAVLFFTTVVPIGLLMRLCGKDPLSLKRDPAAESYWVIRTPPGPAPQTMSKQF